MQRLRAEARKFYVRASAGWVTGWHRCSEGIHGCSKFLGGDPYRPVVPFILPNIVLIFCLLRLTTFYHTCNCTSLRHHTQYWLKLGTIRIYLLEECAFVTRGMITATQLLTVRTEQSPLLCVPLWGLHHLNLWIVMICRVARLQIKKKYRTVVIARITPSGLLGEESAYKQYSKYDRGRCSAALNSA